MKKTHTYCDVCETEIDDSIIIPKVIKFDKSHIEVVLKADDDSDICIYCFIKAVNKLDKRPKAAHE